MRWTKAAVAIGMVVAALRGVALSPGSADAAIFPLPGDAILELEASGLEGSAGNRLEIGGQVIPFTHDATGFSVVSVPVPASMLRSGRIDAALLAGNTGTAPEEGYDDFSVRDVQLVLADGTVVADERYVAGRSYHVG